MLRILIIVELFDSLGFILQFVIGQKLRGNDPMGECLIARWLFVAGKLSMGASWAVLAVQVLRNRWIGFPLAAARVWIAVALMTLGVLYMAASFLSLGSDTRFGLGENQQGLRADGVFGISRNPMYMGFYLVTLASLIAIPHPVNIFLGLLGIWVHHPVALAEERYLLVQYAEAYEDYCRRVRRYI